MYMYVIFIVWLALATAYQHCSSLLLAPLTNFLDIDHGCGTQLDMYCNL